VTLVEWGDFQCPPCGRIHPIVEEALEPYGDRVRFVFRQNPLNMHRYAWKAAEASLAAHAQGRFFEYKNILFHHQNALDVDSLKRYATEAGLDRKRFDRDLDSGRFAAGVYAEIRQGARLGVLGTPVFFVNGVKVDSTDYGVEGFRRLIDAALAR
jgi:protein-disulfide isomerase